MGRGESDAARGGNLKVILTSERAGRCREGSDGSLRSFDRELKARSRQFSDATSIVTMGGGWCSGTP